MHISLAPFMGITSKSYRNAFARNFPGLDRVYSPFISGVHPDKTNISKFSDVLPFGECSVDLVPQFVSTDSKEILAMGEVLAGAGYQRFNWNMGCPFSRIANKKRGCGILPFPDEIQKLLDEVMNGLSIKLSVKTRLGYRSTSEIKRVIDIFNQYPLDELIIHPRTGTQLYKGDVHLDEFYHCLERSKIPVTYNGDIYHLTKYNELKAMFPTVNSWMVGRGALINPFLPAQIKSIRLSDEEKRQALKNFHNEIFALQGEKILHEKRLLGQMKAIWYYMSGVFTNGKQYFKELKVCQDYDSYLNFVEDLLLQPFATDQEIENHWKGELKHVGYLNES